MKIHSVFLFSANCLPDEVNNLFEEKMIETLISNSPLPNNYDEEITYIYKQDVSNTLE